jgi:hypothetical protein
MQIKKELLKRSIGGDSFLIPMGKTIYDTNGMFILTEMGAFLWDLLPQAQGPEDLVQAVLAEYEVDEQTAREDIDAFLEKLSGMGIL